MFMFTTEDNSLKEANAALVEENRRLRAEVQEARVGSFILLIAGNVFWRLDIDY